MKKLLFYSILFFLVACSTDEVAPDTDSASNQTPLYFPPVVANADWATTTPESLGWETTTLTELYQYLESQNSRAFIILKDGKIVVEKYWGNQIQNDAPFIQNSAWYWASAGKSLTAFLVGLAQQKGLINIDNKSSDYLGKNWTSLPTEKEDLITVKHQLSMTTGLDYQVIDTDCTDPTCLKYGVDAGQQWFYHNAPYTLLGKIVENASGRTYNAFTNQELENKIGMEGAWLQSQNGFSNMYWSTARDMARFGLLILNQGTWNNTPIMTDEAYFQAMTNSSQTLNPSYGYLWWLNGKNSFIAPSFTRSFSFHLAPNAPEDLLLAAGKNGQFIDIIPSLNMVVIRMGDNPEDALVPITFHNDMWKKIMDVIQ